jgi:hypothetical protein
MYGRLQIYKRLMGILQGTFSPESDSPKLPPIKFVVLADRLVRLSPCLSLEHLTMNTSYLGRYSKRNAARFTCMLTATKHADGRGS